MQKKNVKNIFVTLFACLFGLCLTLIPAFALIFGQSKTAAAESADLPTVSLSWDRSSGTGMTVDADGYGTSVYFEDEGRKGTLYAKVTLSQAFTEDVKVNVATYDISARRKQTINGKSVGDYDAVDTLLTIPAGETSAQFSVTVYQQYDFYRNELATSVYTSGKVGEKVFGVRIVSAENATVNVLANSIIGKVKHDTSSRLAVRQNAAGSFVKGVGDYSYEVIAKEYEYSFSFPDNDLSPKQSTTKTMNPVAVSDSNGELAILQRLYGSELSYYYRFQGNVLSSCWNATGITFTIKDQNDSHTLYDDDWSEPSHKGDGSHYELPLEGDGTVDRINHLNRETADSPSYYFKYNNTDVSFYVKNRSLSTVHRHLKNWSTKVIIDNTTKPSVRGYRLDNKSYGYGDEVYIAVDFSKPVQVINGDALRLRTYINNKEVLFNYAGGTLTDTLFFKYSFDGTEDYNAKEILVVDFETMVSDKQAQICDFFLNTSNENNTWDKPVGGTSSQPMARLSCSLDTRTPSISSDYVSNKTLKSHTVPVNVSRVTSDAKLAIAWTDSKELSSVKTWTPVHYNGEETVNITGSNFTGSMYLHVRATSATGKQTRKTFGPYQFDNTPPIIGTSTIENGKIYVSEHKAQVFIYNSESGTYLDKVYLYAKDLSGKVLKNTLVYQYGGVQTLKNVGGDLYEMTITSEMAGLETNSYGEVLLGFEAIDSLGNESPISYGKTSVAFDNRETFEARVVKGTGTKDFTFQGTEVNVIDERREFTFHADGSTYSSLSVKSIARNGTLIYDSTTYEETMTESAKLSGYASSGLSDWQVFSDSNGRYVKIYAEENAAGYYEFVVIANGQRESQVIRIYCTGEDSQPTNYQKIYAQDRLLVNEVWRFATNYYYQYGKDPVKYVDVSPDRAPIFSSKEKALEYAKYMEYQDMKAIVLTSNEASQLNTGGNSEFMKATVSEEDDVVAAAGQIWIRYKSANWKLGTTSWNSASSWVYYYYSSGAAEGEPIISDAAKLPQYLEDAVTANAKKICGYDGEPYYITANNGHQSAGKALDYERKAVFAEPLEYTQGFAVPVRYSGDPDIFDNTVTVTWQGSTIEAAYLNSMTLTFENGYGEFYYRMQGTEEYSLAINGDELSDSIRGTGLYEIVEISDQGYKEYLIYVDNSAPVLSYDYLHRGSSVSQTAYIDKSIEGSTFNAKEITLKEILFGDNGVDGYTSEKDEYAYLYIMNSNGSHQWAFMTLHQLQAMEDGYPLSTGTYQVYVYDRLGNQTYMILRVNAEELEVTHKISTNNSITFYFNRGVTEIVEESFAIYRDGVRLDVEYSTELKFRESGEYRIVLTDIYGYKIDESFEFTRDYPDLRFYYIENGRYQEVLPIDYDEVEGSLTDLYKDQAVIVLKKSDNSYYIISAQDVRITYDNYTDYVVNTKSGNPEIKMGGINSVTLDIAGNQSDWAIQIAYEDDPYVYVSVACSYDEDAPIVEGTANVNLYEFNDHKGASNVLFTQVGRRDVPIYNGDRTNSTVATFTWTDENEIYRAYYVKHGENEEVVEIEDVQAGQYTVKGAGEYTLYVIDLIGNTAEFNFMLAETVSLTYMLGEEEVPFKMDPLTYIDGDVYTDTQYTGEDVKFLFNNYGHTAFVWSDGVSSYVYQIDYTEDGVVVSYALNAGTASEEVVIVKEVESGGSGTLVDVPFRLEYGPYNGQTAIIIPKPTTEYTFWQFRLVDAKYVTPVILQIVQSNVIPTVQFQEEDGDTIQGNSTEYVGVNSAFSVVESSISEDVVSIVAYYSSSYTMDFTDAKSYTLYGENAVAAIDEHGYYKVVVTNIYGNQQVIYLRLSFAAEVNVLVSYEDGVQRTYSLGKEKEMTFKSNQSVAFSIWDKESEIVLYKDGKIFAPKIEHKTGYDYFILTESGEYSATVKDFCGNVYSLTILIESPREIEYGGYLTDFNADALYKERLYSNAAVSLNLSALQKGEIGYVAYVYVNEKGDRGQSIVLYDVISQDKQDYSQENFYCSIGVDGDGSYEVTFSDFYGNKVTVTVKISTAVQLSISRTTQSSVWADDWTLADALETGVWSNRLVTLTDKAAASKLTIDGEEVAFVNGKYVLEYPATSNVEHIEKLAVYVDEYGNKYAFTVHLYRKVPEVEFVSEQELITLGDDPFVKGSFAYEWSDAKITATYVKDVLDGEGAVYENGQELTEDGLYVITFTDIAGNVATRSVTIDTKVSYQLKHQTTNVPSGITVNDVLKLEEAGEKLTVLKVEKDGEELEVDSNAFMEHGSYQLVLEDALGNSAVVTFTVYTHAMNSYTYVANEEYSITQVWYHREEGLQSNVDGVYMDEETNRHAYRFEKEGQYEIELYYQETGETFTFSVRIDDTDPTATLVGVEAGASTRKDVTFDGLKKGDVVKVYRNKQLVMTYQVETDGQSPIISKAGKYRVVISDEAENTIEYTFTREFTTNTASNVFILLILVVIVAGGFVYLVLREKNKIK